MNERYRNPAGNPGTAGWQQANGRGVAPSPPLFQDVIRLSTVYYLLSA
jgi:hypothetical protein